MAMRITRLQKHHDRTSFDCDDDAINQFLRKHANQGAKRHASATHVLADGNKIIGYYTLTAFVLPDLMKQEFKIKYPYDMVSVKLARLGVDKRHQGHGYSKDLIFDALMRTAVFSHDIGNMGLFVDAKNESLCGYYEKMGFHRIDDARFELWMPIDTINQLLE